MLGITRERDQHAFSLKDPASPSSSASMAFSGPCKSAATLGLRCPLLLSLTAAVVAFTFAVGCCLDGTAFASYSLEQEAFRDVRSV